MPITLSFGYIKPETGDRGSVWFPDLEDNFQQLNDHTHDGTDSAKIPPSSLDKSSFNQTILAATWTAGTDGNGNFTVLQTVPAGVTEINDFFVRFIRSASGDIVYPTFTRVSGTTYNVTLNEDVDVLVRYV